MRERIAQRIHDLHNPGDWADHDFNGECGCYRDADAVLDELGWDTAPRTVVKEDEFWIGDWPTEIGTYRLVREATP